MRAVNTIQLLTFTLANEVYALDVAGAREVVEISHTTPIPKTPEWIRGVYNFRRTVIPVLDLKHRLGMGPTLQTKAACILILEIELDGEDTLVGVLADAVREVIEIDLSEIEPPPKFGSKVSTKYVRGMGRRNGSLFVLLDVAKAFAASDIELVQRAAEESSNGQSGADADFGRGTVRGAEADALGAPSLSDS